MNDKIKYWGVPTTIISGCVQRDTPLYRDEYDKGYHDGIWEFIKYLKEHSFLCDPGNMWSFDAIDVAELDDFAKEFLEGNYD